MALAILDSAGVRDALGVEVDAEGHVTEASLARLIMAPLQRWGVARRQAVTMFVHRQLDLAELLDDEARERARDVFEALLATRDIERAEVHGEPMVVKVPLRVVRCGDGAFLWGTAAAPGDVDLRPADDLISRLTRWLPAPPESLSADHPAADAEECGLATWLGVPGYLEHLGRRGSDRAAVADLWPCLEAAFDTHGGPVLDPASYRALGGAAGDYFGQPEQRGGRWRALDDVQPGLWCAARRGRDRDQFSVATLCRVSAGGEVEAMDLYDWDEWRWALLSRGVALGQRERVRRSPGVLSQTTQLPHQLATLLRAVARRDPEARWSWRASDAVLDELAAILREVGGLAEA